MPQVHLDQATQAALDAQQAEALSVAAKYPTVAQATAAGYVMSTQLAFAALRALERGEEMVFEAQA